jgi:hypothetical protein
LSLSELIVYNNSSSTSATLQLNSNVIPSDGNFAMSTGLDINGNLNVTGSTSINNNLTVNGTNSFTGTTNIYGSSIINGGSLTIDMPSGGATITFPVSFSTTTPIAHPSTGLGIYWNGLTQQGEIDLISYGQGGVGGFSLFSVNDTPSNILTQIANFFPNGSTIYTSLDISGNHFTLSNEGSYSVLSITPGSFASTTLLGVSTSLQIGSNTTEPNCYLQIQNGDVSGNLSINANDGNFAMTTGLDVSGNITLDGSLTISNSTSSGTLILNSSNIFNMNTGLVASGSISGSEFKIGGYVLGINNNNFAMNAGLTVTGVNNITLDGSLNLVGPNSGITFSDGTPLNSSSEIPFVNQPNTFIKKVTLDASLNFSNNYGITFSDGSMLTSASGAGAGGASLSGTNNFTALNTFEAGLDISGALIFTQQNSLDSGGSPYVGEFLGISLNASGSNAYLCFPYTNNGAGPNGPANYQTAFYPYLNYGNSPSGLGITWSYLGYGETDLIGYGGGNSETGGITIYSHNNNKGGTGSEADTSTRIADFWPSGSNIYNSLTLGGNLILNNTDEITNIFLNSQNMVSILHIPAFSSANAQNISTNSFAVFYICVNDGSNFVTGALYSSYSGNTSSPNAIVPFANGYGSTMSVANISGGMQLQYSNVGDLTVYNVYIYSIGQLSQ